MNLQSDAETQNTRLFGNNGKKKALMVIGAGIAGIQVALDSANAGFQVYLVEQSTSIGGHMAQLDKTFPTLDCSSCILTPKMADISRHPRIKLLTCSDVSSVTGQVGDFHVILNQQPRYVDIDNCTGCGLCAEACPVSLPSEFNQNLSTQKAIARQFPQAIPAAYMIEKGFSPCKNTCPAHIPVQGYVTLIAQGKYKEAVDIIRLAGIPFVGTLGRVCYHPCESQCKRGDWDEPLAICGLKRFAYDAADSNDDKFEPPQDLWPEKVAIVGAGPAGLTAAYELRRKGYPVTIYDALPVAGGMLAVGIPAYRLPRAVLDDEIEFIRSYGVQFHLNTPIGGEGGLGLDQLKNEYPAIFLAIGAHNSSRMNIPGEECYGVLQALSFLKELNLNKPVQIGKRVAVIGGGNSAIDAARCALRLGSHVQILYRRTRAEMPAAAWEVDAAQEEGVELKFLVNPVRVIETNGTVSAIECQQMTLGEPDASGRRRPVPVPGSEFFIEVDTVIAAIGQNVETRNFQLEINRNRFVADPVTLQTSLPGIFAGGDAVLGPASVVEAVGAGIEAAESIHRYLRGTDLKEGRPAPSRKPVDAPVIPVGRTSRQRMPELATQERFNNFQEVELGFSPDQARAEAQRCLSCAICSECLQCVSVCQRNAIDHNDQPKQLELDVGAIVVATGFDAFNPTLRPELGYGRYPQVITTLEFERLASASGPTSGKIRLNGQVPKKVAFIQCVGSRDTSLSLGDEGNPYCSRVCCMVVAKQAHLAHDRLPDAEITVFYIDVRAFGKGFEEFYDRVRNEGVVYRRGNPSEIIQRGENVVIRVEDTLLGEPAEVEADLVVLAVGINPRKEEAHLSNLLNINRGADGFYQEDHSKLRTVESNVPGILLAGCCQGPKDIPDTVAHAKAAASAAMILLAGKGAGYAAN